VKLEYRDGSVQDSTLVVSTAPPWNICLASEGPEARQFEGTDLFAALIALREHLESQGVRLLCQGARRDVHPSGMSRSMGGGRKAYIVRLGPSAEQACIVDIFDYAPPDLIASVEEQRSYAEFLFHAKRETRPHVGEMEEARRHPNGWVYRIARNFGPDASVPPEAIIGAWKVDGEGSIVGEFIHNDKYDPFKWPPKKG
jgi:hypothetical protein